ncbi:MAG: hypothetical protein JST00_37610 [Deltaproteobacteria bacterium]|nr:hypothetical protein [Deltaproteobacteria bacterium]
MRLSFVFGLLVAGGALALPRAAYARDLTYQAPDGCPTQELVAARLDTQAPEARPVSMAISLGTDGFHGELVIGEGPSRTTRSIDARTCSAVVEAFVLVVALDREAPPPEAAAPPTPDPSPASLAPVTPVDADRSAPLPPPARTTRWSLGNTFTFRGVARGVTLNGLSFFLDAAAAEPLLGAPFLEPSARVALGFTFPSGPAPTGPLLRDVNGVYCPGCGPVMTLVAHDIDLCPIGAGHHGSFTFSVCQRTELGVLVADNAGSAADARARFWASLGGVARARVLLNRGVARAFFEMETGALGALRRDRFHFEGYDTVVARPWAWVVGASAGVALP